MEVYVDNILVKSNDKTYHLDDSRGTFDALRKYKMKLNTTKCVFAISSRNFLGFILFQRGIETNLNKTKAIMDIKSLKTVKEVQSLTEKVVALNKFISRVIDKCLPFFKVLKKVFQWIGEGEDALTKLKDYLT